MDKILFIFQIFVLSCNFRQLITNDSFFDTLFFYIKTHYYSPGVNLSITLHGFSITKSKQMHVLTGAYKMCDMRSKGDGNNGVAYALIIIV